MPISTWIRDLFGIRKDVIDIKKSKLEIELLEHEKREREFLIRATKDDIEKYDPSTQRLLERIAKEQLERERGCSVVPSLWARAARIILQRLEKLRPPD